MSVTDRVTLVLKARPGETLADLKPFIRLGSTVMIGRGGALISGASDEDLQMVLGRERDERQAQAELWDRARLAPPKLAAHAQEMFDLLRRIDVKCGGLDAALSHGMEPSEQMWQESREAKEAIWDLLDKIASDGALVDTTDVNQLSESTQNVNQTTQNPGSLITEIPAVAESMHIDERIKTAAAEPSFLTVVFKLPNIQAADQLVKQLPYGQKALGTEAEVFGLTTGNLMEVEPCES